MITNERKKILILLIIGAIAFGITTMNVSADGEKESPIIDITDINNDDSENLIIAPYNDEETLPKGDEQVIDDVVVIDVILDDDATFGIEEPLIISPNPTAGNMATSELFEEGDTISIPVLGFFAAILGTIFSLFIIKGY